MIDVTIPKTEKEQLVADYLTRLEAYLSSLPDGELLADSEYDDRWEVIEYNLDIAGELLVVNHWENEEELRWKIGMRDEDIRQRRYVISNPCGRNG
jgi:hypothetical protein